MRSLNSEEKKLWDAMSEDEQYDRTMLENLRRMAHTRFHFVIQKGGQQVEVRGRVLLDSEILDLQKDIRSVRPDIELAREQGLMTPEDNQKIYAIMDKYIVLSTGLDRKDLEEVLSNVSIKTALFEGIVERSTTGAKVLEQLDKFR